MTMEHLGPSAGGCPVCGQPAGMWTVPGLGGYVDACGVWLFQGQATDCRIEEVRS